MAWTAVPVTGMATTSALRTVNYLSPRIVAGQTSITGLVTSVYLTSGATVAANLTNATLTRDNHPAHHNLLASTTNTLQTRVTALEARGISMRTPPRTLAIYTTASLSAGASEQGVIPMAKSYRVLQVQTSAAARVRLYTTTAKRAADVNRAAGADPGTDAGVVLDVVTSASYGVSSAGDINPEPVGASTETVPTAYIPITVTPTAAGSVTITVTYAPLET